jgi:asparagine synthase (glutamine-hydrolysing)
MCGIAGLLSLAGDPIAASTLRDMSLLLAHRGPDDDGIWVNGPVGLAHRRLSIIDLSPRGRNPMANEDETIWLVFNGEIYNYNDFRSDLLHRGHRFRSETDSEVIIHLYEELGAHCIDELNGMFAFALWDGRQRRLLLGRDRFGVKPLYYTLVANTLAFASEVKAFLALPDFRVSPDPFALAEHFTFQNTFGERSFFEGVKLLPAGHCLTVEDGSIQTRRHWDLQFQPRSDVKLDEWARCIREHFEAAVMRQLMSEVPLGTYLSGGMDTGSISAVASRRIPKLHTFTCGFDLPGEANELEQYFDERSESQMLSRYLGTVHHELELGPDAMASVLPRVVWHLDEPRVGISYQIYCTAAMIRRHVTVVLSGVGGDELFAGYPWRYESVLGLDDSSFETAYYRQWNRLLTDHEARLLFSHEINQALGDFSTFDSFRAVLKGSEAYDPLHRALYFDFKTFLNGLLVVDDKLAMAHSLEARVPFLDNHLVDEVARVPAEFKLAHGQNKIVLREAMRGLVPNETLSRRKQGFTPPDQSWYRRDAAFIEELILSPRALDRGYFRPTYLRKILDDHLRDRRNNRFLLWSLMCFEWWNRLFVDGDSLPEMDEVRAQGTLA